jgi:hypothetical protein
MAHYFHLDDFIHRLNRLDACFTEDDLGYEDAGGRIFYSDEDLVPKVEPESAMQTIGLYAVVASLVKEMKTDECNLGIHYDGHGLKIERSTMYCMNEVARVMAEWVWQPWVLDELCTRHFEFDHKWFRDDCPGSHNIATLSDLPKGISLLDILNLAFVQAQMDWMRGRKLPEKTWLDKIVVEWSRKDRIKRIYNLSR